MEPLIRSNPVATALTVSINFAAFVGEWAATFRRHQNEAQQTGQGGRGNWTH